MLGGIYKDVEVVRLPSGSGVKNLLSAMQETQVLSLGQEYLREGENGNSLHILAWGIS